MSHYMTALAMRQTGIKPAAKIVLYWIADHHNGETGECFPSINRLADLCEMSRRAVEGHIAELERIGLLKRHTRIVSGRGQTSNGYTLHLVETAPQNLRTPPADFSEGPTQNLRTLNLGMINQGSEPEKKKPSRAVSLPDEWCPSEKNIADAEARGFTHEEINHEADRFRDYHLARGSSFKDWNAAWRTWLGNAKRYAGRGVVSQPHAVSGRKGTSLASIVAQRRLGHHL
jgi:hypothetical protein